jgi:hypothetical protein
VIVEATAKCGNLGALAQKSSPQKKGASRIHKDQRDARTALPQNCSPPKYGKHHRERNSTIEGLDGTNEPLAKH